jgi:large subunit ribosomal protein L1
MMRKRGKKYREAVTKYDRAKLYSIDEAIANIKTCAYVKFDESVDIDLNVNIKKGTSVRDTVVLPHQFAKEKKILVFAKGDKAEEAKNAGAAFVGDSDLIEKIKGGWLDFDIAIATPDMMKDVGKLGQILGRRGLMPNPKTQTVTFDIKGAMSELKKGRMEFRADKSGVIHMCIGKLSMESGQLKENAEIIIKEVSKKKPSDVKGDFVKTISLSSTMGPGMKITFKPSDLG